MHRGRSASNMFPRPFWATILAFHWVLFYECFTVRIFAQNQEGTYPAGSWGVREEELYVLRGNGDTLCTQIIFSFLIHIFVFFFENPCFS